MNAGTPIGLLLALTHVTGGTGANVGTVIHLEDKNATSNLDEKNFVIHEESHNAGATLDETSFDIGLAQGNIDVELDNKNG